MHVTSHKADHRQQAAMQHVAPPEASSRAGINV